MNGYIGKTLIAFSIGLCAGSAFAANRKPASMELPDAKPIASREIVTTGDALYAQTETYSVHQNVVDRVNLEMTNLGLSEDVDFAWITRTTSKANVNFVCYSIDCSHWAKQKLRTLASAPNRPEEKDFHNAWKDPELENKKAPEMSEDEKIKQRQQLHYKRMKQG